MDQFFGTAPKAVQEPNTATTNVNQDTAQQLIAQLLTRVLTKGSQNVMGGDPAFPYNQPFAAPVTGDQTNIISQIMGQAGPGGNATGVLGSAQGALQQILSGQPQDYSQYFKDAVAAPLENTFKTQTLPAIQAAFGRSAGGTNSMGQNTGFSGAVQGATESLNRNLTGAQTSLSTSAVTEAMKDRVAGVGLAPSISGGFIDNLMKALGAASIPQTTQQTQLTGQANQWQQALQALLGFTGTGAGFGTAPTIQQGNTVALPSSPGILGELIAAAGSAAKSGA